MDLAGITPAQPVTPCDNVRKLPRGVDHYRSSYRFGSRSLSAAVSAAETALAAAWAKDQAAHEQNAAAIAHNLAMRERLTAIMKAAGVPDSYRAVDPKSRAWPQKHKTFEAGYVGDLRRTFVTGDGFSDARLQYDSHAKLIAEAKKKAEDETAARNREVEAAREKRKADIALAGIILRYQLAEETDWPEALDALRKRNKYLDLAIAGQDTRGDWSEGFYRVEDALGRFTIETDQDKDIVADICGCLRSDETDGRVFRDTVWNYSKLFELVTDAQLLADARTCMENQP